MMFKAATLTTLSLVAHADFTNIQNQMASLTANSSMRAFSGQIANSVRQLDEFGCWCYFYDNVGRGKGTPVDEIDAFCKTLADGYECAIRDCEDEGTACVPWEVDYNGGNGAGVDLGRSCAELNTEQCAIRACAIEGQFVQNLFAVLVSGSSINYEEYAHANGFNPSHDEGCPVKAGVKGASGNKGCCGAYPTRYPFKTLDGDRACCGSRTYNTQLLNCCPNGQVKANC